jgi:hypothetical protein
LLLFLDYFSELDRVIKELQPVQFINIQDYNSILLDQIDEKAQISGVKLINNYRWTAKVNKKKDL